METPKDLTDTVNNLISDATNIDNCLRLSTSYADGTISFINRNITIISQSGKVSGFYLDDNLELAYREVEKIPFEDLPTWAKEFILDFREDSIPIQHVSWENEGFQIDFQGNVIFDGNIVVGTGINVQS